MTNKPKEIITMIVVDADGEIITAANGHVSSDNPELVKKVKEAGYFGFPSIRFFEPSGTDVSPSLDPNDLIGITAALFSAKPGRTILLEAPAEVQEWLEEERAKLGGSCVSRTPNPKNLTFEELQAEASKTLEPKEIMRRHLEKWGNEKSQGDK
jgi:hypothetical protein